MNISQTLRRRFSPLRWNSSQRVDHHVLVNVMLDASVLDPLWVKSARLDDYELDWKREVVGNIRLRKRA